MLTREQFAEAVSSIISNHGALGFEEIICAMKSDPTIGFIPYLSPSIESIIRETLYVYSTNEKPKFLISNDYKWSQVIKNPEPLRYSFDIPRQHQPWLEIGSGSEFVYGLFSPKRLPKYCLADKRNYPIKIGRTKRNVVNRLRELQTGSFDKLQLGILVRTSDCQSLEKFLHEELEAKKYIGISTMREWFSSSIEEIASLNSKYSAISKNDKYAA